MRRCFTLEREEQEYKDKVAALHAALAEGDASGIFEGEDPFGMRERWRGFHLQSRSLARRIV